MSNKPAIKLALWGAPIGILLGALVVISPSLGAIVAGLFILPVLLWSHPTVGIVLLAFSFGFNIDVVTTPVHLSLPQLLAMSLAASIGLRATSLKDSRSRWASAGGIFAAAMLPSIPLAVVPASALVALVQFILLAIVFGLLCKWVWAHDLRVDLILSALLAGGIVASIFGFYQFIFSVGHESFKVGGVMRVASTYGHPNNYGTYLAALLPISVGFALKKKVHWISVVILFISLLQTGSGGSWIGGLIGTSFFLALIFRRQKHLLLIAAALLLGLITVAISLAPESFIKGRFDFSDWSSQQRLLVLLSTWDGIMQRPIVGYGPDSFGHMLGLLARFGLTDDVEIPHNLILQLWFEFGLLATFVFLRLSYLYIKQSLISFRVSHDARLAGLVSGFVGLLTASMFGTLLVRGLEELLILIVVLTLTLIKNKKHEYTVRM